MRWSTQAPVAKPRTREGLRFVRWYCPEVFQIALVSDKHNDNVGIGMVTELLQPTSNVDIGGVFGDVVDEKGTDCASVVAV